MIGKRSLYTGLLVFILFIIGFMPSFAVSQVNGVAVNIIGGQWVQFYNQRNGELWKHTIINNVVTHTKLFAGPATQPAISPNGQWVAFIKSGRLSKISINGGSITELSNCDGTAQIRFPSNDWIYIGKGRTITRVNANSGAVETVANLTGFNGETNVNMAQFQVANDLSKCVIRTMDGSYNEASVAAYQLPNPKMVRIVSPKFTCSSGLTSDGQYVMAGNYPHDGFWIKRFSDGAAVTGEIKNTTVLSWAPNSNAYSSPYIHINFNSGASTNSPKWFIYVYTNDVFGHGKEQVLINWVDKQCIVTTKDMPGDCDAGDFWVGTPTGGGNTPPTVNITSPANNATFTAPANITYTATASDAGGSVSKVEWFNGASLVSTDTDGSNGWTFVSSNTPAAVYKITAKATDNGGATAASAVVTVTVNSGVVNTPPTVSITSPANNATFTAGANITFTATASDLGGSVSKVEWFNEASLVSTDTDGSNGWTFVSSNTPAAVYKMTAKATDNGGATATSAVVTVTVTPGVVNTPPTVSINSPANNATFTAPATLTIIAEAGDKDGTVSKVEFFNGTTLVHTDNNSADGWQFVSNNTPVGIYPMTARATDNAGAMTTSTAVGITVTAGTANIEKAAAAGVGEPLTLFASPSGQMRFILALENQEAFTLSILSITGREVWSIHRKAGNRNMEIRMTSSLQTGVYFAVIKQAGRKLAMTRFAVLKE